MKILFIILTVVTALFAAERKDTLYTVSCDTVMVVRTLKDSTITTVIKEDTLNAVKPKKDKKKQ